MPKREVPGHNAASLIPVVELVRRGETANPHGGGVGHFLARFHGRHATPERSLQGLDDGRGVFAQQHLRQAGRHVRCGRAVAVAFLHQRRQFFIDLAEH